ncbi:MAG: phosphoglycerate mutase [Planctomycetes bacterium DG_23]|nr:MAG: phosphoglycerate mutase [Planctomycetes bacterium DG_23]
MKYAIIVPDGMADFPQEELGGKTPIEAAYTPNMDRIAREGKLGIAHTIPEGLSPGSDVANLSLLGYDPLKYYTGRAPLEVAAAGLEMLPGDLAFRCNLVTVADEKMADYSAGHISSKEARALMDFISQELGSERIHFHPGKSYRNIMLLAEAEDMQVATTPPHDIIGEPIKKHLPKGKDARRLLELMQRSRELLEDHEINRVRVDLQENPANMIWLWGQGKRVELPSFEAKYGIKGAAITAVDLVAGIARLIGWDLIDVPGATGYLDTDYAAKGKYASRGLADYDLVYVHIEAPDEASHEADLWGKIKAIEQVDKEITGPVLERLKEFGEFRIMVLSDHYTPLSKRTHVAEPVPFAIYGSGIEGVKQTPFTEAEAKQGEYRIDKGYELMEYFLKGGRASRSQEK